MNKFLVSPTEIPIVVLPENVRYALAHNDSRLWKKEIIALLYPQYGLVWVWLALKYHEQETEVFLTLFEKLVMALGNNWNRDQIFPHMRQVVHEHRSENSLQITGKISYIARIGFSEFCDGLGNLYTEKERDDVVMLVANSWLMGLSSIIAQLEREKGEMIVCFPKLWNRETYSLISATHGGDVGVTRLNQDALKEKIERKSVLVLDDISSTGKTESRITELVSEFSPQKIRFKTLIRFPDKSHSTVN